MKKRLINLTVLLLFGAMVMLMTGMVHAAPKTAKQTAIAGGYRYNLTKKRMERTYFASIQITGASEDAAFSNVVCSDKRFHTDKYIEGIATYSPEGWFFTLFTDNLKGKGKIQPFTVTFDVKDGGKTWHLKTSCKFVKNTNNGFQSIKIAGKKVDLTAFRNIDSNLYAEVKAAGKKAVITCKMKKGYTYGSAAITRKGSGKTTNLKKPVKLKKGDILSLFFAHRKSTEQSVFTIVIK